jgi:phosphoadenylyl-sulfate reductase (thioredoxin)
MTALLEAPERVTLDDAEAGEYAARFEEQEPEQILSWAIETFARERLAIVTSLQLESLVLLDMAQQLAPGVRAITIDTGRLPQASHDYLETLHERFNGAIEVVMPDPALISRMVQRHGSNSFRRSLDLRLLCCQLRKVRPLEQMLTHLDAWVTGLRRDQWATRAGIRKLEIDHDHGGLVKLNPLADWSREEVEAYAIEREIPAHPLAAQGFSSIGCEPCTRAVAAGEDARSGRWWWESNAPKECGMHCSIETGGFEHELHAILGAEAHA